MIHARTDYDSIQPYPTKRPHTVRIDGEVVDADLPEHLGKHMDPIIPDDEPVFLLRGQDRLAGLITDQYADLLVANGYKPDSEIVVAVRTHARRMWQWAQTHPTKLPDIPEGAGRL